MLSIQQAGPAHSELLSALCSKTFHDTYAHANTKENMDLYISENFTEEEIKKELSDEDTTIFIACLGEKAIGYIKLGNSTSPKLLNRKPAIEIERIYVLKNYQSKKTGKLLLDHAITFAKEKNMQAIWLGVWENNLRAIKFYEREGFKKFATTPFTLGRDLQNDFMMKLEL